MCVSTHMQGGLMVGIIRVYRHVDIAKEASMCIVYIHDDLMTVITHVCSHTYRRFSWLESHMCFSIDKTSCDRNGMHVFTHM